MSIPDNERTTEQWVRLVDIIFEMYYSYDIISLIENLQDRITQYEKIINDLKSLNTELSELQAEQYKTIGDLQKIVDELHNINKKLKKKIGVDIFLNIGYTFINGMNLGVGFVYPIFNFTVGGYIGFNIDFIENKNIGWFGISLGFNF